MSGLVPMNLAPWSMKRTAFLICSKLKVCDLATTT